MGKGGPGLESWLQPAWEGGLSGPEGGDRRVWSGMWKGKPTGMIYAPSLGQELGGTAIRTTKGRFSWRPPDPAKTPKETAGTREGH